MTWINYVTVTLCKLYSSRTITDKWPLWLGVGLKGYCFEAELGLSLPSVIRFSDLAPWKCCKKHCQLTSSTAVVKAWMVYVVRYTFIAPHLAFCVPARGVPKGRVGQLSQGEWPTFSRKLHDNIHIWTDVQQNTQDCFATAIFISNGNRKGIVREGKWRERRKRKKG